MPRNTAQDAQEAILGAVLLSMTEKQLQAAVVRLARVLGYRCYHPFDSRRSAEGYPDLTIAKLVPAMPDAQGFYGGPRRRVIHAELKTQRGKLTPAQEWWCLALNAYVWRPSHLRCGAIERVLRGESNEGRYPE